MGGAIIVWLGSEKFITALSSVAFRVRVSTSTDKLPRVVFNILADRRLVKSRFVPEALVKASAMIVEEGVRSSVEEAMPYRCRVLVVVAKVKEEDAAKAEDSLYCSPPIGAPGEPPVSPEAQSAVAATN